MPRVTSYQPTPNPNALKCVLDGPLAPGGGGATPIRSFRNASDAVHDPLASTLMAIPGITSVLLADHWLTVNKSPEAEWAKIKKAVEKALGAT